MANLPYDVIHSGSMSDSTFEWDEHKDLANREKHGVSFFESQAAFSATSNG